MDGYLSHMIWPPQVLYASSSQSGFHTENPTAKQYWPLRNERAPTAPMTMGFLSLCADSAWPPGKTTHQTVTQHQPKTKDSKPHNESSSLHVISVLNLPTGKKPHVTTYYTNHHVYKSPSKQSLSSHVTLPPTDPTLTRCDDDLWIDWVFFSIQWILLFALARHYNATYPTHPPWKRTTKNYNSTRNEQETPYPHDKQPKNETENNEPRPTTPPCNRHLEEKLRLDIFFTSRKRHQQKQTMPMIQLTDRQSQPSRNDTPPTDTNMNPTISKMQNQPTRSKKQPTELKLNPKAFPMQSTPTRNENPSTEMQTNPKLSHTRSTTTRNKIPQTKMKLSLTDQHMTSKQPPNKTSQTELKFPCTATIPNMKVSHMSMKWHHQTPNIFNWTLQHLDAYLAIDLEPGWFFQPPGLNHCAWCRLGVV